MNQFSICFLIVLSGLLIPKYAQAQTYEAWRSENIQANLLNGGAWWNFTAGKTDTMVFGQQEFDNNVQTSNVLNNGGNTFSTWRWLFKAGASSARTFTGDGIRFFDAGTVDGGIYNESSATHIFNIAVNGDGDLADPFQIHLNSTGGLTFGSTVNNQGGNIEILGSASGAKTVRFNGVVSGSGGMYVNNANATVLFDAVNTISGQLTINAGTVRLNGAGDTFGASTQAIRIGGGASIDLNGVSTTVGSVGEEGTSDSGTINLGAGTLTISGSATTFQNSISGTGGLTHSGSGTLNLFGTQSYTGTTTVSAGKISSGVSLASSGITVSGGTFETSAADIVSNTSAVNLSAGTYALGGNDTVASLTVSGGVLSSANAYTLTAATYALNGGEVSANLGAGTVNATSGTTLLSGTSGAGTVNVSGGLLSLVSADRLANAAAVTVSSGELAVGANDTVGSLSTTGGTVSGAGTLTAATYALNGGTVSANLGVGTATASSGTTSLSGTSAATVVNVTGGTLNTSGANKLADGAAVSVSSGTLGVGGSDTVGSLAASGTGVVTVATGTTLTANGNSSITGSARATGGTVAVANNSLLNLANSSTTTTSDLSIGSGSTLAGTGGTSGQIKGSGLLSPGNSPGILTSGSVDLTGGIDFAFEFTAAGAPTYSVATNSKNDLLHLTSGSAPFSGGSFTTGNTVSFYFNDAGLSASLASVTPTTYLGGFFVDSSSFDIAGLLSNATKQYFIAAAGGSTTLNGVSYTLMSDEVASRIILSNVNQSGADFTTGTVNGTVLGVMAVPEPSSGSLLLAGIGCLIVLRRYRKNA